MVEFIGVKEKKKKRPEGCNVRDEIRLAVQPQRSTTSADGF